MIVSKLNKSYRQEQYINVSMVIVLPHQSNSVLLKLDDHEPCDPTFRYIVSWEVLKEDRDIDT